MPSQKALTAPSVAETGMVFFLGAWAMMFAALLFAYVHLRLRAPAWPPTGAAPLPLGLPVSGVVVLLASRETVAAARSALLSGRRTRGRACVMLTLGLGLSFIALQGRVGFVWWGGGLRPASGGAAALAYFLTALHVLHVLLGLALLGSLVLLPRAQERPATWRVALALSTMFWRFIAVCGCAIAAAVHV